MSDKNRSHLSGWRVWADAFMPSRQQKFDIVQYHFSFQMKWNEMFDSLKNSFFSWRFKIFRILLYSLHDMQWIIPNYRRNFVLIWYLVSANALTLLFGTWRFHQTEMGTSQLYCTHKHCMCVSHQLPVLFLCLRICIKIRLLCQNQNQQYK